MEGLICDFCYDGLEIEEDFMIYHLGHRKNGKEMHACLDCISSKYFQGELLENLYQRYDSDFCRNKIDEYFEQTKLEVPEDYKKRRLEANDSLSEDELRQEVLMKDGRYCNLCHSKKDLTIDHIIPVSKGGSDDLENLQILCQSCNSSKSDLTPKQWKRKLRG